MAEKLAKPPIKIECIVEGYEDCYILFKASGWKYRHLREWENVAGAGNIAAVFSERVEDWHIVEDGQEIPFVAGENALDELPPPIASWMMSSYIKAYYQVGLPSPN